MGGGHFGVNVVDTLGVYDPATDTVPVGSSWSTARAAMGAVLALDNQIYGVGGTDNNQVF